MRRSFAAKRGARGSAGMPTTGSAASGDMGMFSDWPQGNQRTPPGQVPVRLRTVGGTRKKATTQSCQFTPTLAASFRAFRSSRARAAFPDKWRFLLGGLTCLKARHDEDRHGWFQPSGFSRRGTQVRGDRFLRRRHVCSCRVARWSPLLAIRRFSRPGNATGYSMIAATGNIWQVAHAVTRRRCCSH